MRNIITKLKAIFFTSIILWCIFLFGGGLHLVGTFITQQIIPVTNDYETSARMAASAPAAIFCLIIGVTGLFLIYLGGKHFHRDGEKKALIRFIVGANMAGFSYVGLELLLRFSMNAII